jgi:hypothetical protein
MEKKKKKENQIDLETSILSVAEVKFYYNFKNIKRKQTY